MNLNNFLKNKTLLLIPFLILFAAGVWFVFQNQKTSPTAVITSFEECQEAGYPVAESYPASCRTQDGQVFTQNIGNELEKMDLIRVDFPRPNVLVTSPLRISGEARGIWFFEANFPITLVDANGQELSQGFAVAQTDWMSEDFVPFEGKLMFESPPTSTGTLILQKSNPSGLAEQEDQLEVPVRFK